MIRRLPRFEDRTLTVAVYGWAIAGILMLVSIVFDLQF